MRLSHLRPVLESAGPFATAYVRTSRATATAVREIDLRARHVRDQLAQAGAPSEAGQAITEALAAPVGTTGLADGGADERVFVWGGGSMLFDAMLPETGDDVIVAWEPVPRLMTYVRTVANTVPHVVAVVNRVGGDLVAFDALGRVCEVESVDGETWHLRKVKVGDWAHLRYLHHVEERWKANAKDVAAAVDRLVEEVSAQRLVLAGDVRAREKLRDELSARSASVVTEIDSGGRGGQSSGIDEDAFDSAVNDEIAETARHSVEQTYARFEQWKGKRGAAAEGTSDVLRAASQGQLDTLLIGEEFDADAQAWIGSRPTQLASTKADLKTLGADLVVPAPVGSALLRAAVCTDAEALTLPGDVGHLRDGIGALLRY